MAGTLPAGCSVSLDLSHIGLAISPELALANGTRIAEATAATDREMIISAEGSGRTDAVLAVHRRLSDRFGHVGVTVQARLHRSPADLAGLLRLPGRIRLVKEAFLEPETIAYARDDAALTTAYLAMAGSLAGSGHPCSFATHDWDLIHRVEAMLGEPAPDAPWEFETLLGLGPDRLAAMAGRGHPTREYVVFGTEWWLYVCNRLAEDPTRLFQALTDAAADHHRWSVLGNYASGLPDGAIRGGRFSYGVLSTTVVRVVTFAAVRMSWSSRSRSAGLATRTSSR
jgi:proline dehydrogenase